MKIIAADDETSALNILTRAITEAVPDAELRTFKKASEVVREVGENGYHPEVAFLDIEMPGMAGLELAHEEVAKFCPTSVNTVRVTTLNYKGECKFLYSVFRMAEDGKIVGTAGTGKLVKRVR